MTKILEQKITDISLHPENVTISFMILYWKEFHPYRTEYTIYCIINQICEGGTTLARGGKE